MAEALQQKAVFPSCRSVWRGAALTVEECRRYIDRFVLKVDGRLSVFCIFWWYHAKKLPPRQF